MLALIDLIDNHNNNDMAKYDITAENGSLVLTLDTNEGQYEPRVVTLRQPGLKRSLNAIKFFDGGIYQKTLYFESIGDVAGATPTDINDAFTKILAAIPTAEGGSGGTTTNYNDPDIYQLGDLTLPHTFASGTLHSISITSTTGDLTIEVNNVEAVVEEGQTVNFTASTTLDETIEIISTTGTYTITVLKQ